MIIISKNYKYEIQVVLGRNYTFHNWYFQNKKHRDDDLPAVIWEDGSRFWWQKNNLHRLSGDPTIIWANGDQEWHECGIHIKEIKDS